jgi:hypothetical protein
MNLEQQPLWIIAQILNFTEPTALQKLLSEIALSSNEDGAIQQKATIDMLRAAAQDLVKSNYPYTLSGILPAFNYLKFQHSPRRTTFHLIAWAIEQTDLTDSLPSVEEAAQHLMNLWVFLLICAVKRRDHQSINALSREINLLNELFLPL